MHVWQNEFYFKINNKNHNNLSLFCLALTDYLGVLNNKNKPIVFY